MLIGSERGALLTFPASAEPEHETVTEIFAH